MVDWLLIGASGLVVWNGFPFKSLEIIPEFLTANPKHAKSPMVITQLYISNEYCSSGTHGQTW